MTFLEIIRHSCTNLPIEYTGSFREDIKKRILDFGEIIDNSTDLSEPVGGIDFTPDIFKRRNKILREGILETIDAYYGGDPAAAYTILKEALNNSIPTYLDKDHQLPFASNLYRIRINNANFPLTRQDLFHIPFNLRSRVNTQRYSIPGLPSLYLANSLYVAWEELGRPGFNEIHAARIVNNRELMLLDLTTDIFARSEKLIDNISHGWYLLYKVMTWPLVAACSVKVKNRNDPFKPEYIIPQLLLQWVNKGMVYGIKYSSTHIDLNKAKHEGIFYNVVIPVRTFNIDEGHCPELCATFTSTQVLPLQLRQFVTSSDRLAHQSSIRNDVNPQIEGIELIKGYVQPYASTIFGILEHNLNGIETENF